MTWLLGAVRSRRISSGHCNDITTVPRTHFSSVSCGLLLANDFYIPVSQNSDAITTAAATPTAPVALEWK